MATKPDTPNPYAHVSIQGLESARKELVETLAAMGAICADLKAELADVERAIALARPERGLGVSDHAVLRYLERVRGIDIETVRQEVRAAVRDGHQITPDTVRGRKRELYVIGSGQIVTVLPVGSKSHNVGKRRAND